MTEQFDAFANPSPASRQVYPLVVCLQSTLFAGGAQQIVAPLAPQSAFPTPSRLTPTVRIDGDRYVVAVASLTFLPSRDLKQRVANLAHHREALLGAIDLLFYGV